MGDRTADFDQATRAQYTRRTIIDIARRRQRPGSGSLPTAAGSRRMEWPDVSRVLAGIPHAIVGAVATREYMQERATTDLDIVVLERDTSSAQKALETTGYTQQGVRAIGGTAWRSPEGTPLDVIEGRAQWWSDALDEAAATGHSTGSPVLPLNWLVLMKLLSSRAQDVADVSRMLGAADEGALARVRATIGTRAPELSEDVESLIALGKLEGSDAPKTLYL